MCVHTHAIAHSENVGPVPILVSLAVHIFTYDPVFVALSLYLSLMELCNGYYLLGIVEMCIPHMYI